MNIIIYPSLENLNVNSKMFRNVKLINDNYNYNFKCIEDDKIPNLKEYKSVLSTESQPNSITILLDNYGTYIFNNIDFIINSKHIKFYIHECDIHENKNKPTAYKRYNTLRSQLQNLDHIYILAYYWYHYLKIININENNLICFPKFIFNSDIQQFNNNPINKILISGSVSAYYPFRKYFISLNNPNVQVLSQNDNIRGDDYMKYLNKYLCCFSCCSVPHTPYITNKFFEIPGCGSLLLAHDEYIKEPLQSIGFIDGENYISCNKINLIDKVNFICNPDNINEINRIRLNGYELVKNNHTEINRYKQLYNLIIQVI